MNNTKDIQFKLFFRENDRAADLINGLFYQGEEEVCGTMLEMAEVHTDEFVDGDSIQRSRDLLWKCTKNDEVFLYGIEHQSTVDWNMALRFLGYGSMGYIRQIEKGKKTQLIPISTACVYTGEKKWDAPKIIKEMMPALSEKQNQLVQDYSSRIFELSNENYTKYHQPEVREMVELAYDVYHLSRVELIEKYQNRPLCFPDSVETAAVLTGCNDLKRLIVKETEESKVCQNFQKIVDEIREEGIEQGIERGIELGREEGIEQGIERGIELGREEGIEQGIERGIELGREKGIEQGIELGRNVGIQSEKIKTIKRLYDSGVEPYIMSLASGLTLLEVSKVLRQLN